MNHPAYQRPDDALFSALIQSAGDAIVSYSADGRVTSWNAAAERLFGFSADEVMGALAPHLSAQPVMPREGRSRIQRRHRNGHLLDIHAGASVILDAEGCVIGWSEILRPLTLGAPATHALETTGLIETLAGAIGREEIRALYQPVFALRDRQLISAEVLLRWEHPEHGTLTPDHFIPLAELTGDIDAFGLFALRSACEQLSAWQRDIGRIVPLSVNVSAHQLRCSQLVERFAATIHTSGASPDWLRLEITESALIDDELSAASKLEQLRALGMHIAIDDFGVGYSSLSRLRDYRIDTLKLDRSFVSDIATDSISREVVGTIIRLAHRLDMLVIAEGIEADDQLQVLIDLGCDCGQGFLLGQPMPAGTLAQLI
ncbi:MAG: EAL domain-containing protein [Betaproteobacteria bacterium]|nr:EAL domain-containing protein [Betaproteobacteria bacterium]